MQEPGLWKKLCCGDKVRYHAEDFDGVTDLNGVVTAVYEDHAVVHAGDMCLWVDEDTEKFFSK